MRIFKLSAQEETVWRIKAKVFSSDYVDQGVEVVATSIGEARKSFFRLFPDKASLFDPDLVVPEPDWKRTEEHRTKRRAEKQVAKTERKRQKAREDHYNAETKWQIAP